MIRFQTGLFLVKNSKNRSLRQNRGKHKGEARAYVRAGNSEKSVNHNKQTNRQTISFKTVTNVTSASRNNMLRETPS